MSTSWCTSVVRIPIANECVSKTLKKGDLKNPYLESGQIMCDRNVDNRPQLPPHVCFTRRKCVAAGAFAMPRDVVTLDLLTTRAAEILLSEVSFDAVKHLDERKFDGGFVIFAVAVRAIPSDLFEGGGR